MSGSRYVSIPQPEKAAEMALTDVREAAAAVRRDLLALEECAGLSGVEMQAILTNAKVGLLACTAALGRLEQGREAVARLRESLQGRWWV